MITAMVKGNEVEQENWTVCSQEVPPHLKDSVREAKERNKTRIDQVARNQRLFTLAYNFVKNLALRIAPLIYR